MRSCGHNQAIFTNSYPFPKQQPCIIRKALIANSLEKMMLAISWALEVSIRILRPQDHFSRHKPTGPGVSGHSQWGSVQTKKYFLGTRSATKLIVWNRGCDSRSPARTISWKSIIDTETIMPLTNRVSRSWLEGNVAAHVITCWLIQML